MDATAYANHLAILKEELVCALGCTEPIAVAYASALARTALGCMPEHSTVSCSGNIVKNVKSVTVPNSNGMLGIEAAATLGVWVATNGARSRSGVRNRQGFAPRHASSSPRTSALSSFAEACPTVCAGRVQRFGAYRRQPHRGAAQPTWWS
jgi:hypothetical protein